jgi:Protein of unknown function (DUF3592)
MKPENSATLQVISVGCFLVFLVFLGLATPFYLKQRTVLKTWPTTDATVEDSSIAPVAGRRGTNYMARFLLQYRVGDQIRTGLVASGYADRSRAHAQQWLDKFPVGSKITIAYNPLDPAMVRMNPGYNRYFFAVPLFITEVGLIFAAVALVLLFIARAGRAKWKQAVPQQP